MKLIDFREAYFIEDLINLNEDNYCGLYRPPELALGYKLSESVHMWSLGCILYELVMHRPLFCYDNHIANLAKGIALDQKFNCSRFTESQKQKSLLIGGSLLQTSTSNGFLEIYVPKKSNGINEEMLKVLPDHQLVDFISKCLEIDPFQRLTVEQAMSHPFLKKI